MSHSARVVTKADHNKVGLNKGCFDSDWLIDYKNKNFKIVELRPTKKSQYFDLSKIEELILKSSLDSSTNNSILVSNPVSKSNSTSKINPQLKDFSISVKKGKDSVSITPWSELDKNPKLLEKVKNALKLEWASSDQYEAFVNSNFSTGAIIEVKTSVDEVSVDKIIELEVTCPEFVSIKNVYIFEEGTKATVVERVSGENVLLNTTIIANESSDCLLVRENNSNIILTGERAIVFNNALLKKTNIITNSLVAKVVYVNQLIGEGAEVSQKDILFLNGEQRADVKMVALHQAHSTVSETRMKCVMNDSSKESFDGLIKILPKAQLSKSYLEANSMMLSQECTSVNIPKLEIEADDVKATHSATVEHLEPEKLFYLESRAIDRETAEKLVVSSFLQSELSSYPESIKEEIRQILERKLSEKVMVRK